MICLVSNGPFPIVSFQVLTTRRPPSCWMGKESSYNYGRYKQESTSTGTLGATREYSLHFQWYNGYGPDQGK